MPKFRASRIIWSCQIIVVLITPLPVLGQSWSAWKQVAEEQASKGDLPKAEEAWKTSFAIAQDKGNIKDSRLYISALELARVQKNEKKSEEARNLLNKICTDELAKLDFISEEELNCIQTYLELSNEANDKSEADRAAKLLEQVRRKHEAASSSHEAKGQVSMLFGAAAEDDLRKRITQAQQLLIQKNFAEAEKTLDELIRDPVAQRSPHTMQVLLSEQCKLYDATRNYKKAENCAKQLVELAKQQSGPESRNYVDALIAHSKLLHLLGQNDQAGLEDTLIAYTANKMSELRGVRLPSTRGDTGTSGGVPSKPPSITINPSSITGSNYRPNGNMTVAELMALADKSTDVELLKFVASLLYNNHDYKNCLPYVEKLVELLPQSPQLQLLLCGLYIETQRATDAIICAKKAVFMQADSESYSFLIDAYSSAGDMENHKNSLEDFISRYPNDKNTAGYKVELARLDKALSASEKVESFGATEEEKREVLEEARTYAYSRFPG